LERHQTLRAAIDWSYNLLPDVEQGLFRRLSIFIGGWSLEAAEFVCSGASLKSEDVLDTLEHLINKSLVMMEETQTGTRYYMLETIRQYANEKLVDAGESDALHDRHLEFFINLVETAEPHLTQGEQLEWLARLDADYENIRSALEWALNQEAAEHSLRLCAALGWFWVVRGHWREGTRWLKQALDKSSHGTITENTARVKALYQDAALANCVDDIVRMEASAQQSMELADNMQLKRELAIARFYAGWTLDRKFDYDGAIPLLQQSLKDFQELNEPYWESVAYRWLGNIFVQRGQMSLKEKVQNHLNLARRAGERQNLGEALLNYAYWLKDEKYDVEGAEKYALEAYPLLEQIGSSYNEFDILLASLAWLKGEYQKAREGYMASRDHFGFLGDRQMKSVVSAELGWMELEQGNLDQAQAYLEESLATAREFGDKRSIVYRQADLGNLFYRQRKIDEFKQSYRESFRLVSSLNLPVKRGLLVVTLDFLQVAWPENTARLLGVLSRIEVESGVLIHPISKRYYDRAEAYTRKVLGDVDFEARFLDGQQMTPDEALDLASQSLEQII
jgi:tetratricopeptide (TPR) repeat protein